MLLPSEDDQNKLLTTLKTSVNVEIIFIPVVIYGWVAVIDQEEQVDEEDSFRWLYRQQPKQTRLCSRPHLPLLFHC